MADITRLLHGLADYARSLELHLQGLRASYSELENRWHKLKAVYEGEAAREFHAHWQRTAERFREYQVRCEKIAGILEERIEALREADRPTGL